MVGARTNLVRFPNPLLEVGWDYTAPIGGEFFFPPSQRGQFGQHMAKGVLIGLLHITGSHMLKPDFFFTHWSCRLHSIFILRQNATFAGGRYCSWISHFPAFRFLTGSSFVFSAQRSAIFVRICAGIVVGFVNRLDFIFSRTYLDDTIVQLTHVPL